MAENSNFKEIMQAFAQHLGWEADEIDESQAHFLLTNDDGEDQELMIFSEGEQVEIIAPSLVGFTSEDELPHDVSTELLQRNADLDVGAWTLIDLDSELLYALRWTLDLDALAAIERDRFGEIAADLLRECADFDSEWDEDL